MCSIDFPRQRKAAAALQRDDADASCNELQSVDDLHFVPENTKADESAAKKTVKHAENAIREIAIFPYTRVKLRDRSKKKNGQSSLDILPVMSPGN